MLKWSLTLFVVGCLCLPSILTAEEKNRLTFTDAKTAEEGFEFQGEYVGAIQLEEAKTKVGIQVVGRGDGNFDSIIYIGGLPGSGWFAGTNTIPAKGTLKEDQVVIGNDENDVVGIIKDDKMRIVTENGKGTELGVLEKVSRKSPTEGAKPPEGAKVLFDGKTAEGFENGELSAEGFLKQGVTSKFKFKNAKIHIEFQVPYMPFAKGQERGNSGCYLQGRYEVQMLDSFGLTSLDNDCGAIYSVKAPKLNMCYPPLSWQTYDINFKAPVYDEDGNKIKDARISVRHNGVAIQKNVSVSGPTRASILPESDDAGPLFLQDHSNPVRYRNIWIVAK